MKGSENGAANFDAARPAPCEVVGFGRATRLVRIAPLEPDESQHNHHGRPDVPAQSNRLDRFARHVTLHLPQGALPCDAETCTPPGKLAVQTGQLAQRVRDAVRAAMRERGVTQWDLAHACGISQSTVSAWLCGRKDLSSSHLFAVLEALEIDFVA